MKKQIMKISSGLAIACICLLEFGCATRGYVDHAEISAKEYTRTSVRRSNIEMLGKIAEAQAHVDYMKKQFLTSSEIRRAQYQKWWNIKLDAAQGEIEKLRMEIME